MRVFLIGYEPPGWNFGVLANNLPMQRKIHKLMDAADMAALAPAGWPVGKVMTMEGSPMVCIEHEHDGKVVLVRPVPAEEGAN